MTAKQVMLAAPHTLLLGFHSSYELLFHVSTLSKI